MAGTVWMIAGFNVSRMGLISYSMLGKVSASPYRFVAPCFYGFCFDVLSDERKTHKTNPIVP